jgi:hypothetical protein
MLSELQHDAMKIINNKVNLKKDNDILLNII